MARLVTIEIELWDDEDAIEYRVLNRIRLMSAVAAITVLSAGYSE